MKTDVRKNGQGLKQYIPWALLFLFWSLIMYYAPFSSDDYYWGGFHYDSVDEMLIATFTFGNGRLLGNILVNILVRTKVFRVLIKAAMITSVIWMIPKLLKINSRSAYVLLTLLFMAMDADMFGQVFVWTAGFSNFFPPIWATCAVLLLIQTAEQKGNHLATGLLIFLLGFSGQLCVESNTLLNVLLAIGYTGWGIIEYRRGNKRCILPKITWLVSAAIGACLMFLIPVIAGKAGAMDDYRGFHLSSLMDFVKTIASNAIKIIYYFENNTVLCMLVAGLTLVILNRDQILEGKIKHGIAMITVASAMFILWDGMFRESMWIGNLASIRLVVAFVPTLALAVCFAIALCLIQVKQTYVIGLLFLASIMPFFVITPVSKRCVMLGYVFLSGIILLVWDEMERSIQKKTTTKVRSILTMLVCTLAVCLCLIFNNIHALDSMRQEHIQQEMNTGTKTIEIFRIPYRYVYWDEEWCFERYYRYEELFDIDFVVLELLQWNANNG